MGRTVHQITPNQQPTSTNTRIPKGGDASATLAARRPRQPVSRHTQVGPKGQVAAGVGGEAPDRCILLGQGFESSGRLRIRFGVGPFSGLGEGPTLGLPLLMDTI